MRAAFATIALVASCAVACSLLLDDEGLVSPDATDGGIVPREDATTPTNDAAPPDAPPPEEIGNGRGSSGPLIVTSEIIVNQYAALAGDAPAGSSTIDVDAALGWSADQVVLVWETTGLPGTPSGQTVPTDLAPTPVGRYELARLSKVDASAKGMKLTLTHPLANGYRVDTAQVVRVPEHTDVTIQAGGSLTAQPWDGARGGIVALLATGRVQVDGAIVVDGRGFRGGASYSNATFLNCASLDGFPRNGYAAKGEGLSPSGYATPPDAGDAPGGYGAVANAAGGGDCHNAGGGGGGNGGAGGKGGRSYSGAADVGGNGGGVIVIASLAERIVLGAGGGAGDAEDSPGETALAGGAGGGVIFVRADLFLAPGTVSARGISGSPGDFNGGGGGGAGGSILLRATKRISCGVTMSANGGNGSSVSGVNTGPGGGGGGGRVLLSSPVIECTPTAPGGTAGTVGNPDAGFGPNYGAVNGLPGTVVTTP